MTSFEVHVFSSARALGSTWRTWNATIWIKENTVCISHIIYTLNYKHWVQHIYITDFISIHNFPVSVITCVCRFLSKHTFFFSSCCLSRCSNLYFSLYAWFSTVRQFSAKPSSNQASGKVRRLPWWPKRQVSKASHRLDLVCQCMKY